jgi:hypothetical protein
VGVMRREGSGEGVARVKVSLHGASGLADLEAVTDERGWFWFPLPLPGDWYTAAVADAGLKGATRVWLRDRRPDELVVVVGP